MKVMLLVILAAVLVAGPAWSWDEQPLGIPAAGEAPLFGPPKLNAYGPAIHSDATGRPFQYGTSEGEPALSVPMKPDAYGPGIGMDNFGQPIQARPWP